MLTVPHRAKGPSLLETQWWQSEPGLIARLLQPVSWLYRALASADREIGRRGQDVGPTPVIAVGNWVVGGAGKTPTTLALLEHLKALGWTAGVVTRGYGRRSGEIRLVDSRQDTASEVGDEPLLISQRSQVPVCVGRDRRHAKARLLQAHPEVNIIVADDALQHHRLSRDLDIIVVDERGAGNGLCLPAGPLREPLPRQVPARALLLYSAGVESLSLPGHMAQRHLSGVLSLDDWARGEAPPIDGGWAALQGQALYALAGIASPHRFFAQLQAKGLAFEQLALPDHDPMDTMPWPTAARNVIMTEKDAVKARRWAGKAAGVRLWVARLDLVPDASFWAALNAQLTAWPVKPERSPVSL